MHAAHAHEKQRHRIGRKTYKLKSYVQKRAFKSLCPSSLPSAPCSALRPPEPLLQARERPSGAATLRLHSLHGGRSGSAKGLGAAAYRVNDAATTAVEHALRLRLPPARAALAVEPLDRRAARPKASRSDPPSTPPTTPAQSGGRARARSSELRRWRR